MLSSEELRFFLTVVAAHSLADAARTLNCGRWTMPWAAGAPMMADLISG
jgi:hypothetical protein